ncbi:NUDIX domain-containing protein [Vibrio cyclitrophicus]|uniref:NUDIX domain-containing protein n=1 Tax=Vibrio cyclitrophicus TaxID=47951 RepID=UPI000CE68A68
MKRIHIVAGIIFNQDKSQVFITKRPDDKHKGGFWEFPGGKVEVGETIEQAMNEDNSWRLELEDGDVYWYSGEQSWDSEPETGKWERMQSGFLQLLPIEKYL